MLSDAALIGDLVVIATIIATVWTASWKLNRSIAASVDGVRKEMKSDLTALENKLSARIDAVERKLSARIDAVERKLSERINAVENKLSERIDAVERKLSELSENVALIQGRQEGRAEEILRSARKESSFERTAQPARSQ